MAVTDPDFELPYSDEDMLARKYKVADCVALYRQAYSLKATSPAMMMVWQVNRMLQATDCSQPRARCA